MNGKRSEIRLKVTELSNTPSFQQLQSLPLLAGQIRKERPGPGLLVLSSSLSHLFHFVPSVPCSRLHSLWFLSIPCLCLLVLPGLTVAPPSGPPC